MNQESLWHESPYDALSACVHAIGGYKKAGGMLWPSLPIEEASKRLRNSLDAERREKLDEFEKLKLAKEAAKVGCHAYADYFAQECGYRFEVVTPGEQEAELQLEFIAAVNRQEALVKRMERLRK